MIPCLNLCVLCLHTHKGEDTCVAITEQKSALPLGDGSQELHSDGQAAQHALPMEPFRQFSAVFKELFLLMLVFVLLRWVSM